MLLAQREADFQERIVAATIVHDPQLEIASSLFDPHGVEPTPEGNIFYPTTPEEFERMAEMFAQEGVSRAQ